MQTVFKEALKVVFILPYILFFIFAAIFLEIAGSCSIIWDWLSE